MQRSSAIVNIPDHVLRVVAPPCHNAFPRAPVKSCDHQSEEAAQK